MIKRIVCFFLILFSVTACDIEPYQDDNDGDNWKVLNFTVKRNDWKLVGSSNALNSYYQFVFNDVRELTDFVYTDGAVTGYLYQGNGSEEVQTPLPYTLPIGTIVNGNELLWTETTTFDYQAGSVAFYINYSDFATDVQPETMEFRVVLHW